MIENTDTQLGLWFEISKDHCKRLSQHHFKNLKQDILQHSKDINNSGWDGDKDKNPLLSDVDKKIKHIEELLCLRNSFKNTNYLLKETALQMAYEIPVQNENFSVKYLRRMPSKKGTFLLGRDFFYRYFKTENNIYVGAFATPEGLLIKDERVKRNVNDFVSTCWSFFRIELDTGHIFLADKTSNAIESIFERIFEENKPIGDLADLELMCWDNIDNSPLVTRYKEDDAPLSRAMFRKFVQLLLFVELSDLTVEILKPNEKTRTRKTGKYVNRSNTDITIVDSKWNVISVRTEGFKVRTHPRMQPCGENNQERKLIWVQQYQKNGYVRRKTNKVKI